MTIRLRGSAHLFGEGVAGRMCLSSAGRVARQCWCGIGHRKKPQGEEPGGEDPESNNRPQRASHNGSRFRDTMEPCSPSVSGRHISSGPNRDHK